MSTFLEVDHIDRVFKLPNGSEYIALKNISLRIKPGEFISLIGHSGCGKSTLLNIIAGLDNPSTGGVVLEGREVTEPGPDRMVVFQHYSLLPWLSVRENIALGVDEVCQDKPRGERKGIIEHHIDLVGLRHAADRYPNELSGGMKQRVAIARALAIRPKLLLLDEPFGALDALTRGGLQEQLMKICEESKVTAVMVTHDVDEALLLSDRIVMLTNGPSAKIGQILKVDIPRPRHRMEVVNHPNYYAYRSELIYFLNQQKRAKKAKVKSPLVISGYGLEKINLEVGFVPLNDCAPLVVAQEKGFFAEQGLEVHLNRAPSWRAITNGIRQYELDAAQMIAGLPLALTLGLDGERPLPCCTALTLSRNGNSITLSKQFFQSVTTPDELKYQIQQTPDRVFNFGHTHEASMHNLILRYWLASGGIDPDLDVSLTRIPPPQMIAHLKSGNIQGYCVGEPWNSWAVKENLGYVAATDMDIWSGHTEKVLGVTEAWANSYPKTHLALIKAVLKACEYCDDRRNRKKIVEWLSLPQYVGVTADYIRPGFIDPYDRGMGNEPEIIIPYNQFYVNKTNCPDWTEMLWIMTQLARWEMAPFPKNWIEILDRVCRTDLFSKAAQELELLDIARDRRRFKLFDGMVFDPDKPLDYLLQQDIKRSFEVQEVPIDCILS